MKFRFPCPTGGSLYIDIDIVDVNVPLLLGLRELRKHQLLVVLVYYLENTMSNHKLNWKVRLEDLHGHLY